MVAAQQPIEQLPSDLARLVRVAQKARRRAYAPYSRYLVGCCVRDAKGKIHTGCNIENAAYSPTLCAERVAVAKMITRGVRKVKDVVLVTGSEEPTFPCGVCLQFLREFGENVRVIAVNVRGSLFSTATLSELLPAAFSAESFTRP